MTGQQDSLEPDIRVVRDAILRVSHCLATSVDEQLLIVSGATLGALLELVGTKLTREVIRGMAEAVGVARAG